MGKYDLYGSYAGLCVSEEEYLNLETMGIIPSDITSLYSGNKL